MTSCDEVYKDSIVGLNKETLYTSLEEINVSSGALLVSSSSSSEINAIPCIENSGTSTSKNMIVLTLSKESYSSLEGTVLTLPIVQSSEKNFPKTLEPPSKKLKQESNNEEDIKKMLIAVQSAMLEKLTSIETKLQSVSVKCQLLEEKIESILQHAKNIPIDDSVRIPSRKGRSGSIIVGVPPQMSGFNSNSLYGDEGSSDVHLVSLNSEVDYPNGSWLGDPCNAETRVRCNINQCDLEALNRSCTTPEKMSLTLLDYLFDREVQACSNISGTGKHGKKQLDPLKIYGIWCHLKYLFSITDKDWHRIKQNLDSKCRTAFRRKQKGMSLTVKGFRDRLVTCEYQETSNHSDKCSQTGAHASAILEDSIDRNFHRENSQMIIINTNEICQGEES